MVMDLGFYSRNIPVVLRELIEMRGLRICVEEKVLVQADPYDIDTDRGLLVVEVTYNNSVFSLHYPSTKSQVRSEEDGIHYYPESFEYDVGLDLIVQEVTENFG